MRLKKDPSRRVRSELVYWRVRRSRPQNVPSDPIIPFPNRTVQFSAKELVVFVPKGLDDSSLAVYCQEWFKKDPSRRVRYELVYRCVHHSRSQNVSSDLNHIVPYGTVRFFLYPQAVNCQATIIQSLRDKTSISS